MDKLLKMYIYVDGVNDTPFPQGAEEPLEIGTFRYDAKRMGGAPTITASVNYPSCLDNEWTDKVYAEFRGEKYYLKQTPTSSYNNESTMYKHDLELISERVILDNVYFYDAVNNSEENSDAVSNSTTFAFFGDIVDLKDKLNASLRYADLQSEDEDGGAVGWEVVVDDNITSDEKLIPFDNAFFSNAIQESYNTFKIPYYFKEKKIHFGYTDNTIAEEFSYGVDDALLSITKSNANYKVVNRVTGVGSSENIPYYYPNNSPKGDVELVASSSATIKVVNNEKFATSVDVDETITYAQTNANTGSAKLNDKAYTLGNTTQETMQVYYRHSTPDHLGVDITSDIDGVAHYSVRIALFKGEISADASLFDIRIILPNGKTISPYKVEGGALSYSFDYEVKEGTHELLVTVGFSYKESGFTSIRRRYEVWVSGAGSWQKDGKNIDLGSIGLVQEGTPTVGDTITQILNKYINTSNVLLPPKYRETDGEQRFYNATNGTYTDDNGETIVFTNPFVAGHPREHIIEVEDIKPTIKEKRNADNLRIDMFSEFAYDDGDNDETYIDEKDGNTYFKHPYFYGKLRIMDFNLFDHAIENQPMTISFTSGDAGACNFEIGATEEYPQMNPVQVDANGNLLRDENGMVLSGIENQQPEVTTFQDRQQDTSRYEVWIALKKEEETYGMLMPQTSLRPKACTNATANDGDTFVILGINLPQSYITAAEQKLEKEIIKYMYENNVEKFKFSIKFSRIYFEENPDVLELLDENSRIYVWYNGVRYTLYVTSMSYYMESDGVLPDITVELDDTLSLTQNALQNAISQVKADVGNALGNIDITALATPYFIRKDQDDEANGVVNFKKGIKFGEGGKVTMYDDNSAKLTIEYLEVTKKATFTSLEIQEKTHVGGQMLISPAAMNCGEVENILDEDGNVTAYRCYMQTKGQGGNDEIFNQFAVGDQAICQTFNAWGSKYYWRLVTAVGEDYIDLSVDDCDEESDIPEAGDKIIQLGHRTDKTRQAAQVLSAHGDNAPSFIMYNGIDSYSLVDKNITGIIWNPAKQEPQMYSFGDFFFGDRQLAGNYITFQQKEGDTEKTLSINADVTFGANSTGLSNLTEWQSLESEVGSLGVSVQKVQDQVDGVVENWNGEGTPTLSNEPAKTWIDKGNAELIAHINDTYINIEEYVDDETTPTAGHAWRWCQCTDDSITDFVEVTDKDDNTLKLHWHPIADSDAVKALKEAAEATKIASEASRLNLLANSAEVLQDYSVYTYAIIYLPITVNAGEKYTFKCENASILSGNVASNKYGVRISDLNDTDLCTRQFVEFGANGTATLTINSGVSNAKARFLLVKRNDPAMETSTAVFRNVSLVKGTTAMATWQDYQGDNGLKNLLSVGETFEGHFTAYTYYGEGLPITVNAGEKYTFHIENISMLSGTDSNGTYFCYLDNFNSNMLSDTASGYINQSGFGTVTIREGVSNAKARFLISKNETSPNSATVRITRMSLVKGTRPMMAWKENTDYLTNAFKNGSTKISGGLTMTQAVMVEDENGTVRGMLNGSNYAKDSTHGRLIVAAGSEGASTSQLAAATTRIYEDGKIVSKNVELEGKITASEGNISNLKIADGGLSASDDHGRSFKISPALGFSATNALGTAGSVGYAAQWINIVSKAALESGMGHSYTTPTGVYVCMTSTQEAFKCEGGVFSGLRPNTRDVSSGDTLNEYAHNVFIASGTISLPSSPLLGQTYKIYHLSTTSLTINGNGKTIRQMRGSTLQNGTSATSSQIEVIELVYGGSNWYATKQRWE